MEGKCLLDVTHEGSLLDAHAGKCLPVYVGDYIVSNDLEGIREIPSAIDFVSMHPNW